MNPLTYLFTHTPVTALDVEAFDTVVCVLVVLRIALGGGRR